MPSADEAVDLPDEPIHRALLDGLERRGASFWADLVAAVAQAGLPYDDATVLAGLWDLVWAGLVTNDSLAPLRAYVDEGLSGPFTWATGAAGALALAGLGVYAYGSIQLFRLRRAGRTPFAASYLLGILAAPLYGPSVLSGWASAAIMLSCVVGGVVIGWLYLGTPPLNRSAEDELGERVDAIARA